MLSSCPLHVLRNLCFLTLPYSSAFILSCLLSKSDEDDDSSPPITGTVLFFEPVIIADFIFILWRLMLELSWEELRVMLLLRETLPLLTVSLAIRACANIFSFFAICHVHANDCYDSAKSKQSCETFCCITEGEVKITHFKKLLIIPRTCLYLVTIPICFFCFFDF